MLDNAARLHGRRLGEEYVVRLMARAHHCRRSDAERAHCRDCDGQPLGSRYDRYSRRDPCETLAIALLDSFGRQPTQGTQRIWSSLLLFAPMVTHLLCSVVVAVTSRKRLATIVLRCMENLGLDLAGKIPWLIADFTDTGKAF